MSKNNKDTDTEIVTLRIEKKLVEKLDARATSGHRSRSAQIRKLITDDIKKFQREETQIDI